MKRMAFRLAAAVLAAALTAGTAVSAAGQPEVNQALRREWSQAAASQDYRAFYRQEMSYRRMLRYPPATGLLTILAASGSEELLGQAAGRMEREALSCAAELGGAPAVGSGSAAWDGPAAGDGSAAGRERSAGNGPAAGRGRAPEIIGPVDAPIYKVNDIYRKILYIKHENYGILLRIRERIEGLKLPVMLSFDLQ